METSISPPDGAHEDSAKTDEQGLEMSGLPGKGARVDGPAAGRARRDRRVRPNARQRAMTHRKSAGSTSASRGPFGCTLAMYRKNVQEDIPMPRPQARVSCSRPARRVSPGCQAIRTKRRPRARGAPMERRSPGITAACPCTARCLRRSPSLEGGPRRPFSGGCRCRSIPR